MGSSSPKGTWESSKEIESFYHDRASNLQPSGLQPEEETNEAASPETRDSKRKEEKNEAASPETRDNKRKKEKNEVASPDAPENKTEEAFDKIFKKITIHGRENCKGDRLAGCDVARSILEIYREEIKKGQKDHECDAMETMGFCGSATWWQLRDAARACFALLDIHWETVPPGEAYAEPGALVTISTGSAPKSLTQPESGIELPTASAPALSEKAQAWFRSAEDLLALELVCFVSRCTVPLGNLLKYLSIAPLLLLLMITTYPLQPQRFLQVCFWGLLLAVVLSVIWVYVMRERDEFLSRVSGTAPDKIYFDKEFIGGVMTFVIPAAVFLLAACSRLFPTC